MNVCEARDVKGLYKKARDGLISGFTGVSQSYEEPETPDLIVTTVDSSIEESTYRLIDFLETQDIIPKSVRGLDKVSDPTSPHTGSQLNLLFFDFRFLNCLLNRMRKKRQWSKQKHSHD